MSAAVSLDALIHDALSLPAADRSLMVSRLVESLEEHAELSPQWQAEIDRRLESIRDGSAKLVPHDEVMTEVRTLLAGIRQRDVPA